MVARKRSDNHYEEAHMSRIATLTAVLTMAVAPAAFAGPVDLRSPDTHDAAHAGQTQFYNGQDLRSPDATTPVKVVPAAQDLRSPDAVEGFLPAGHNLSPSAAPQSSPSDGNLSTWGIVALIAAALAACAGLAVLLRRHLDVGRPVGV
jgi:hypothetical protein